MKFFIDTADIDAIAEVKSMGMCDGVTTNPSLMAKAGRRDTDALLKEICDLVEGPVSGEVVATEAAGMIEEGQRLARISEHMVVKIPTTYEGLKAIAALSGDGIPVNATLVFSPTQSLLVAKAGAAYCSPFVGRLDDIAQEGMDMVRELAAVLDERGERGDELARRDEEPVHAAGGALRRPAEGGGVVVRRGARDEHEGQAGQRPADHGADGRRPARERRTWAPL